ncbi:lysine--tRNA ligase [Microlunatus ginsengisoli]|uniref:lysine--tRNA ligase n=1 Tax=Microlunatus ginsengisoli TaxID=363863 RepID=UPI0031D97F68
MRVRREKRDRLIAEGGEPFPVDVPRTSTLAEVRARWAGLATGEETEDVVSVTGRVVFVRNTGKLCFATLQEGLSLDSSGERLQVMLSLAEVGEESLARWKADVDLGDFVSVTGRVISSKRGELSVLATSWQLASKALRPMPTLHKELSDETRVRQRYADLVVREAARDMVRTRAAITRSVRESLHAMGFVEIETPVLQLVHGGAHARPFNTHLNAFDTDMTLRIALELFLKRAVVGGVEQVYELGRIFRNEGIDSTHSAEFTMLEVYQAWGDQTSIAQVIKKIILDVADLLGSRVISTPAGEIDLDGDWRWLGVYPGLSEVVGEEITPQIAAEQLRKIAERHDIPLDPAWDEQKIVMELFGELVEPTLIQPTFVCDYPPAAQPLARPHRSDPDLIEAWDLMIGGLERGTGFSELIDPVIQRERLTAQSLAAAAGDPEAMQLDEDFLAALEFGAPPMGGLGLGIDRLVMLFTNAGIRETILFPLLRPED